MVIRKLFQDVAWLGLIQVMNFGMPLLTLPVVARALRPEVFGIFAQITSIAGYVGLVAGFGFQFSGPKLIGALHGQTEAISAEISNVLTAMALLGLAAASMACIALYWFYPPSVYLALMLTILQWILGAMTPQWLYVGLGLSRYLAVGQLIPRAAAALFIIQSVRQPSDLLILSAANCAAAIASLLYGIFCLNRAGYRLRVATRGAIANRIAASFMFFVSTASYNIYAYTNALLVSALLGPSYAGMFSIADRIRGAAINVFGPVSQAIYPFLCRLVGREATADEERAKRLFMAVILLAAATLSAVLVLGAEPIVLLFGGERFRASIPVLRWMGLVPVVYSVSNITAMTLLTSGLEHQYSTVMVVTSILGIIVMGSSILLFGLVGSGIAILMTEAFAAVALVCVLSNSRSILKLRRGTA